MKKVLTEKFNSISVKKGEEFVVELNVNGSTGYGWNLEVTAGKATLVGTEYAGGINTHKDTPGAGAPQHWTYRAEEDGEIQITAEYKRAWEKQPAASSHVFQIKVG